MSGFALVMDRSRAGLLDGVLAVIRHRGAAVEKRGHGGFEWGVFNRVDRAELRLVIDGFNESGGTRFSDPLWIMVSAELWCAGLGI
jgi:hypothetical protein